MVTFTYIADKLWCVLIESPQGFFNYNLGLCTEHIVSSIHIFSGNVMRCVVFSDGEFHHFSH